MRRQNSSYPLQRVNNVNTFFVHNLEADVNELIACDLAIICVFQYRKYSSKRGL